ncbi:multidrug resistance [Fusarium sp. NRRL 52700]|nr:multidrug resistance [Fusarium sp. NRRL 52700]
MAASAEPSPSQSSANIADEKEKVDIPSDLEPGEMLRPGYDSSSDTAAEGTAVDNTESQHDYYETRNVTTRQGESKTCKMVCFSANDPTNPKNWSKARKWTVTLTLSWVCFSVAFASAVITPGISGVAERFKTSSEVALLTITLFVCGFGIGRRSTILAPLVNNLVDRETALAFSPLSELYGRRIIYLSTFGLAVIFIIPCAVAKNIQTLLVCRAIDGIAMSVPIANIGGSLADIWRPEERGVPMAAFSAAPFLGPIMGPMIGGFVFENKGWRWLYWLQLILCGFLFVCLVVLVPETYAPIILEKKAKKLRKQTGDDSYIAEHELAQHTFGEIANIYLARPLRLLMTEPIVTLFAIYAAILYGILYMFFVAYPIVFEEGKGFSPGISGLMFLPIMGGIVVGLVGAPFVNRHYNKLRAQHTGLPPPELRLIPMIWGCWLIPIGVFIFAWTSYDNLTWVGPCLAGLPIGIGFVFLYNSFNNYIVDAYQHTAASALAAKTLVRSVWGGCTVLFTKQILERLEREVGRVMSLLPDNHRSSLASVLTDSEAPPASGDFSPNFEPSTDIMIYDIISVPQADLLLAGYRDTFAAKFPYVIIPESATSLTLMQTSPMLLLAILVTSSWKLRGQQDHLNQVFLKALGTKLVLEGDRDMDLLRGLIVYLNWIHLHIAPKTQQAYRLASIAASIAVEFGITQRPGKNKHQQLNVETFNESPKGLSAVDAEFWDLDARRAYLGCYQITTWYSIMTRKSSPLIYNDYLYTCAQSLANAKETPSDLDLVFYLDVAREAEKAYTFFNCTDIQQTYLMGEHQIQVYLDAFSVKVQDWRMRFPSSLIQDRCFDTFLAIPPEDIPSLPSSHWALLGYSILLTAAVSLSMQTPGWSIESARSVIRLEMYIDAISLRVRDLSLEMCSSEHLRNWYGDAMGGWEAIKMRYLAAVQEPLSETESYPQSAPSRISHHVVEQSGDLGPHSTPLAQLQGDTSQKYIADHPMRPQSELEAFDFFSDTGPMPVPSSSPLISMSSHNSNIVYPNVPPIEEDPRARINVMIDIFNAGLSSRAGSKLDRGLYHEIFTAYKLVQDYKIMHGRQISRPLTDSEKREGLNGSSQMITVPLQGNKYRELDMVYNEDGTTFIVEAKNTKTVDHSQLQPNIQLAMQIQGALVYAIGEKDGQERALQEAYKKLQDQHKSSSTGSFPPLSVLRIPDKVSNIMSDNKPMSLLSLSSTFQVSQFNIAEVTGEFDHEERGFSLFR